MNRHQFLKAIAQKKYIIPKQFNQLNVLRESKYYSTFTYRLSQHRKYIYSCGLLLLGMYGYQQFKEKQVLNRICEIDLMYDRQNEDIQNIINEVDSLSSIKQFTPSCFLLTGLLQSLWNQSNSIETLKYDRQHLKLSDGGQVSLDWALPYKNQEGCQNSSTKECYEPGEDAKILFIVHGLTGGSNMNYIQELVQAGQKQGYRCVAYNSRGFNTEMTSPIPHNGIDLQDLDYALNHVKQKYPNAPMFAVGTSFGGNQIVRWVGEHTEKNNGKCFLDGVVGLSVPFGARNVIKDMGIIYNLFLVEQYKEKLIKPHMHQLKNLEQSTQVKWKEVFKTYELINFYEKSALKINKYKNIDHFLDQLSINENHIENINTPLLLIHARDDPIVSYKAVPKNKLQENKNIVYAETQFGAHVCWFTGNKNPQRWYPKPTMEFFESVLQNMENKNINNPQQQQQILLQQQSQQLQKQQIVYNGLKIQQA